MDQYRISGVITSEPLEEEEQTGPPSKGGGRSLTAREQANLEAVIRNDIWHLKSAVQEVLQTAHAKRVNEIKDKFDSDPNLVAAKKKLDAAAKKANALLAKAAEETAASGLVTARMNHDAGNRWPIFAEVFPYSHFEQPERDAELAAAKSAYQTACGAFDRLVNVKQNEISRLILLAGAGGGSVSDLVESVPKARDIIAEVAGAESEAFKELGLS